jgi:hypothetical protein
VITEKPTGESSGSPFQNRRNSYEPGLSKRIPLKGIANGRRLPWPGLWKGLCPIPSPIAAPTPRSLPSSSTEADKRTTLDVDLLDPDDPFEVDDGNRPHLYKHLPEDDKGRPVAVGPEDVLDAYIYGDPVFYEADPAGARTG